MPHEVVTEMNQLLLDRDARPTTCPDCTDQTVNVHGIDTCATCGWVSR
jgi:ribosomal protein L37AE/L43A